MICQWLDQATFSINILVETLNVISCWVDRFLYPQIIVSIMSTGPVHVQVASVFSPAAGTELSCFKSIFLVTPQWLSLLALPW